MLRPVKARQATTWDGAYGCHGRSDWARSLRSESSTMLCFYQLPFLTFHSNYKLSLVNLFLYLPQSSSDSLNSGLTEKAVFHQSILPFSPPTPQNKIYSQAQP